MAHGHSNLCKTWTSDGTSGLTITNPTILWTDSGASKNQSTICVVDGITFMRSNNSGSAENVIVKLLAGSKLLWSGGITIPDGELGTIDKEFVDGVPLWGSTPASGHTTVDPKYSFGPGNGVAATGSGATEQAGSIVVLINGTPWIGGTDGVDLLNVRFHFEPSVYRRN